MLRPLLLIASALVTGAVQAEEPASCTLPGEQVVEDASGDHQLAPAGEGFADILSLHMAEPGGADKLVFSYKMSDLGLLPPDTLWIIRFSTDVPPANGDVEYFVAMLTGPNASPHFVHGTGGPADGPGGAGPLLFTPAGALDTASNFKADGAITLVLDKSKIAGLTPGLAVFGMIPLTHRITPTDGTEPFLYGFRTASGNRLAYDDTSDGFYEILASGSCDAGKSGVLGIGAFGFPALLVLIGFAAAGLRRR